MHTFLAYFLKFVTLNKGRYTTLSFGAIANYSRFFCPPRAPISLDIPCCLRTQDTSASFHRLMAHKKRHLVSGSGNFFKPGNRPPIPESSTSHCRLSHLLNSTGSQEGFLGRAEEAGKGFFLLGLICEATFFHHHGPSRVSNHRLP